MANKNKIFSIYENPQLYDDIMWWKKDDINFYKNIITNYNVKSVLELFCGTGRIGLPIINQNIDYYGLDKSVKFVDLFKSKINNYNNEKIKVCDATHFSLNKKFDLIIIGFNSLAHLITNDDINECFNRVYSHMHSNSIFIIDIFMPTNELTSNLNSKKVDLMDFKDSTQNNKILKIYESNDYNSKTEVNTIKWEFVNENNGLEYIYEFEMRMLFPDTLHTLLADNNLKVQNFYGNYTLSLFNEQSDKQIYICTK